MCCKSSSCSGLKRRDSGEWMEPIIYNSESRSSQPINSINTRDDNDESQREPIAKRTSQRGKDLWGKLRKSTVSQSKEISDAWLAWDLVINNLDKLKIEDIDIDDGKFDKAVVSSFNTIDYKEMRNRPSVLCSVDMDELAGSTDEEDDDYLERTVSSASVLREEMTNNEMEEFEKVKERKRTVKFSKSVNFADDIDEEDEEETEQLAAQSAQEKLDHDMNIIKNINRRGVEC